MRVMFLSQQLFLCQEHTQPQMLPCTNWTPKYIWMHMQELKVISKWQKLCNRYTYQVSNKPITEMIKQVNCIKL
jgi:hypothetical protein